MAITQKQINFIQWVKRISRELSDIYGDSFAIDESFTENFATSQEWSLDPDDVNSDVTVEDLEKYGITYDDFAAAINQGVAGLLKFWTNQAVTQREYGKDFRAIMNLIG